MRTSTILASAITLTASLVSGQYNITSKPFSLVVKSATNKTLDGRSLFACHEGAAIEGLCLGSKLDANSYKYNFNTSFYESPNQPDIGYVVWLLKGGNFELSEPLQLGGGLFSNVAVPVFTPSESGTGFGFDKDNKLYIPGYIDDTVKPINTNAPKDYYNWYICNTFAGYSYTTLAWSVGIAKPQNPSCQKVDVVRVFATKPTSAGYRRI